MATRRRFTGRRRGFRRRRRLLWLPINGNFYDSQANFPYNGIVMRLDVPIDGSPVTFIESITLDSPDNMEILGGSEIGSGTNLGTLMQGGYSLRRIVGHCFAELLPRRQINNDPSQPAAVDVWAGIFVARQEDIVTEVALSSNEQPVGTATEVQRYNNYSPASYATTREPWIWRRHWILGNAAIKARALAQAEANAAILPAINIAQSHGFMYPATNVEYSEGSDAKIDQKTRRNVLGDNRLWLVGTAIHRIGAGVVSQSTEEAHVFLNWDIRLLGHMKRQVQQGAF